MKGVVIAGSGSGAGKTSITTGLLSKLSRSMKVQAFKTGPDFIDPMYHTLATGRSAGNLDSFLMDKDRIRNLVGFASKDADLCIVEGVRGLYEGLSGTSDECSTAELAKTLGFPVIMVINARSLTRSAAAVVNGFKSFDPEVNIAGVILNNVSGSQHEGKLREAFEKYTDVEIVGCVRRDMENTIGERHMGLVTTDGISKENISFLEEMVSDLDSNRIMDICETSGDCHLPTSSPYTERKSGMRVAIPMDDAYCFYYHENIECMKASGMDVKFFSPIRGESLPDADFYYLGGGYPDLHTKEISENKDFIEGLANASLENKPVIGECGGLMTLCNKMTGKDGAEYDMAGVFDAEAYPSGRHGPKYVIADSTKENPLFPQMEVRGHEFHYSEIKVHGTPVFGYEIIRGAGITDKKDGLVKRNTLGSYMHQHALSTDDWLSGIISSVE